MEPIKKPCASVQILVFDDGRLHIQSTFPNPQALKEVLCAAYEHTVIQASKPQQEPPSKIIPIGVPLPNLKDN